MTYAHKWVKEYCYSGAARDRCEHCGVYKARVWGGGWPLIVTYHDARTYDQIGDVFSKEPPCVRTPGNLFAGPR